MSNSRPETRSYIVYNLAAGLLGGSVALHSEVGAGARFILTLPRTAPTAPAETHSDHGFL